jgi:hypothetical protein
MFVRHVPYWYAITLTGVAVLFLGAYRWAFEPTGH